jgi:MarR family transcriptional regulator, 2-MHQ and catechol-resistance regulon repressor
MPTHFQGTEEQVQALDTFIKVQRASSSLMLATARELRKVDLTASQFGVLEALFHLGSMHQNMLCRKMLVSGGNMTVVIDNLEKRGLIERLTDEEDRRCVRVALTVQGRAFIEDYFPKHATVIANMLSPLQPKEHQQLGKLLRKLGRSIEPETE